ncbi:MAG: hypothetical protein V3V01_17920 [Acidimicrobiales bacterium]
MPTPKDWELHQLYVCRDEVHRLGEFVEAYYRKHRPEGIRVGEFPDGETPVDAVIKLIGELTEKAHEPA